jgi:hypothetical protein
MKDEVDSALRRNVEAETPSGEQAPSQTDQAVAHSCRFPDDQHLYGRL